VPAPLVDEALEHPGADAVGQDARFDHQETLLRGDSTSAALRAVPRGSDENN
jgi:hypothetical protein